MTTTHRTRRRVSGRTRALMSLGAVAVLATGLSVQGTFAFWTDSATLNTGSFTAGTLDITVNSTALAGLGGAAVPVNFTPAPFANMLPGESQAATIPIQNNGSAPFTWTATGSATGTSITTTPAPPTGIYTFQLFAGTATNTTANGVRTGSCGTTPAPIGAASTLASAGSSLSTPSGSQNPSSRPLAVGGSENACLLVTLPASADNNAQTKTVSATIVLDAKQVGAP